MNVGKCSQCLQTKQLTHTVKSEIVDCQVCYTCGIDAELVQGRSVGVGSMTVEMIERPKVIPIWFECSTCHGRFTSEQQYAAHWHEGHLTN